VKKFQDPFDALRESILGAACRGAEAGRGRGRAQQGEQPSWSPRGSRSTG
jgi:hypothetical protein